MIPRRRFQARFSVFDFFQIDFQLIQILYLCPSWAGNNTLM